MTARELRRGPRRFRASPEAAESALAGLVEAGYGRWETVNSSPTEGGRPTRMFVLRESGDGDETPLNLDGKTGFVASTSENPDEIHAVSNAPAEARPTESGGDEEVVEWAG